MTGHGDLQMVLLNQACFVANKRRKTLECSEGGCRSIIDGDNDWKKSHGLSPSDELISFTNDLSQIKPNKFQMNLKMVPNAELQCS